MSRQGAKKLVSAMKANVFKNIPAEYKPNTSARQLKLAD